MECLGITTLAATAEKKSEAQVISKPSFPDSRNRFNHFHTHTHKNTKLAMSSFHALFHSFREMVNPILKQSKFKETGVLTPEEFVLAGDFLVYKCPTWSWAAGLESKRRDYLPPDKQYLVTRNVPCLKRVAAMEYKEQEDDEEIAEAGADNDDFGAWVATHKNRKVETEGEVQEIGDMDDDIDASAAAPVQASTSTDLSTNMAGLSVSDDAPPPNLDDIPDMEDEGVLVDASMMEEEDPAAFASAEGSDDKILKTR
jgi:ubiquitin-like-conjugating enzyme ATG3